MPCWKFRAFFKFWSFPILCWRVGTFQNSVHATKQLLHKASQCGSYFCTFRSQTLKFYFLYFPVTNFKVSFQEKLWILRLLSTVALWMPVTFIDVIIRVCQNLATQGHKISKSFVFVNTHVFVSAFVLLQGISLYLSLPSRQPNLLTLISC